MGWNDRFASWMCTRQICHNSVMLSCRYGPKFVRNVSSTLLNLCYGELGQFWRQCVSVTFGEQESLAHVHHHIVVSVWVKRIPVSLTEPFKVTQGWTGFRTSHDDKHNKTQNSCWTVRDHTYIQSVISHHWHITTHGTHLLICQAYTNIRVEHYTKPCESPKKQASHVTTHTKDLFDDEFPTLTSILNNPFMNPQAKELSELLQS